MAFINQGGLLELTKNKNEKNMKYKSTGKHYTMC